MRDEPLFASEPENTSCSAPETLSLEEYNCRAANKRKDKILDFGISSIYLISFFALALIIADLIAQAKQLDSSLIKECISLIRYIITAALGCVFGRKTEE